MPRTSVLALLIALALAGTASARVQGDERRSLEDLLRRARAESFKRSAELAGEVQVVVGEFEVLSVQTRARDAEKLRKRLVGLGAGVAPLLVRFLEPGPAAPGDDEPSAEARFRAAQVALVLRELNSPVVTDALLDMARDGTLYGRAGALDVLATSPEPERVAPVVHEIFTNGKGPVRLAALSTLAALGGPEASRLLAAALSDEAEEIVDTALLAVAKAANREVAPDVLALAQGTRGPFHVPPLLEYYRALPELLQREHLLALTELASNRDVTRSDTIRILDALRELEVKLDHNAKRALEPLESSANSLVAEATLALLASAGDKRARRLYLAEYDEDVERQEDYPEPYVARAHAYYRIGDLNTAIRDYKAAIKLEDAGRRDYEPYVGLAKCYARKRSFKDASEYLERSPLSTTRLRELAKDEAFVDMLETRYRSAFHLKE